MSEKRKREREMGGGELEREGGRERGTVRGQMEWDRERESKREDRIYYSAACSTSLAETMGKRESRWPGTLEHHFRLSISRSLKGPLLPIVWHARSYACMHAMCIAIAFRQICAQAIIDDEKRVVSRADPFAGSRRFVKFSFPCVFPILYVGTRMQSMSFYISRIKG